MENSVNASSIYLRPVQRPLQKPEPPVPSFAFAATPQSSAEFDQTLLQASDDQGRDSVWTHLSTPTRPLKVNPPLPTSTGSVRRSQRSYSHSTVDDHATNERLESGAFRITIDRPATAPKSKELDNNALPTLQVPIPHYRLGTPRFSARGTAFLHSSVCTASSSHEELGSSLFTGGAEYDRLFPRPPGMDDQSIPSRRHSHTSPLRNPSQRSPGKQERTASSRAPSRTIYRATSPILPSIYDFLAKNPDDPTIVKYSSHTHEIVAASPARIIAQVTSENFLDYELLSDFFLTVRAYLSTHDLLSYLFARFEWAINRFDDNGRVIRVRAFAALRHWILNYFPSDFVMDRDLRVKFCDRLNSLTQVVRARADYGASDMKLITDLKKCWNGRCMLYWDGLASGSDSPYESDIRPGGIVGSRNSDLSHAGQLPHQAVILGSTQIGSSYGHVPPGSTLANWYGSNQLPGTAQTGGHQRQSSAATTRSLPISPTSEQSIPALSCSIPGMGLRKVCPIANRALVKHPAPTAADGRRVCPAAPSSLANDLSPRPNMAHRRSGSFSDAARDKREPLSSDRAAGLEDYVQLAYPYAGSLIRGNVISPGEPYVHIFSPTTPAVELPNLGFSLSSDQDADGHGNRRLGGSNNPGVKNLIGNIRRVLSSKNSSSSSPPSSVGGNGPSAQSLSIGKHAPILIDTMNHTTFPGQAGPFKSSTRVDLLSAEVVEAFRQAMIAQPQEVFLEELHQHGSIGHASGNEREQPSPEVRTSFDCPTPTQGLYPPSMRRAHSDITTGSQSIVIQDDTGLHVPHIADMSGALIQESDNIPRNLDSLTMTRPTTTPAFTGPRNDELSLRSDVVVADRSGHGEVIQQSQQSTVEVLISERPVTASTAKGDSFELRFNHSRPSMTKRGQSYKSNKSGSLSLRRYASFQSTFARHAPTESLDTAAATQSTLSSTSSAFDREPARMLRRRPGGDLRANLNVHDLEGIPRPRSTGSITTYTDSLRGSELYMNRDRFTKPSVSNGSPRAQQLSTTESEGIEATKSPSFVRTHSSQPALRRPSFEAAVAEFARIPDDDEGGIEATLLKLEGKYRSPLGSPVPPMPVENKGSLEELLQGEELEARQSVEKKKHREEHIVEEVPAVILSSSPEKAMESHSDQSIVDGKRRSRSEVDRADAPSTVYAESEESYNSVPLLERGLNESPVSKSTLFGKDNSVMPRALFDKARLARSAGASRSSSVRRTLKRGSYAPTVTTDSFLLDEDDDFLSDLSSELSGDEDDQEDVRGTWPSPEAQRQTETTIIIAGHPPSPPMTMENALSISSQANQAYEKRKPPTPDPSPVSQHVQPNLLKSSDEPQRYSMVPTPGLHGPQHIPFILGHDSELLAQQLTIIEKDALSEIDWSDLVEMRWQVSSPTVTNWVDYLRMQEPLGIDLVTARFNLMVKWALSEIILTQNIEERALSIMKYIHVAHQARKIHNYATMLQLTIALSSVDCTRLTKTWALVPAAEKKILQELETLVSPRRNFHNLRIEMEKANTDAGCIPVVGMFFLRLSHPHHIDSPLLHPNPERKRLTSSSLPALYIHDLTYNSQKPALIDNPVSGEPLVNFERYRVTALIVKSLLRLIDASTKYAFQPVEGVIDRCLWMAALPDDLIRQRGKELEA